MFFGFCNLYIHKKWPSEQHFKKVSNVKISEGQTSFSFPSYGFQESKYEGSNQKSPVRICLYEDVFPSSE